MVELRKVKDISNIVFYFIRFHIYPDVKLVKIQKENSALLKQPNGDGWIIRSLNNNLNIEKNIFLGRKTALNSECICISGSTKELKNSIQWEIEKIK